MRTKFYTEKCRKSPLGKRMRRWGIILNRFFKRMFQPFLGVEWLGTAVIAGLLCWFPPKADKFLAR